MIWRPSEHEELTTRSCDEHLARDAIDAIVSDAAAAQIGGLWPGHPLDDVPEHERFALYPGSAGMIWGLWRLGASFDASAAVETVVDRYTAAPDFAAAGHALRGYVDDDVLRVRVTRLLERTALRHDGLVNWLPSLGEPIEKIRVQWCHGAPGIVSTLGDLIPECMLLGAGELIWRAGPLRKGAGLCHGTAGNGFALLKVHELTGDDRWLARRQLCPASRLMSVVM